MSCASFGPELDLKPCTSKSSVDDAEATTVTNVNYTEKNKVCGDSGTIHDEDASCSADSPCG